MNKKISYIVLSAFLVLVMLFSFGTASAKKTEKDKFVFGSNYELYADEVLDGNLVVMGGNATLHENSSVRGDIAVFGGNIEVRGKVDGDIVAFGGNITLLETAQVRGDFTSLGGNVNRSPKAVISGDTIQQDPGKLPFSNKVDIEHKIQVNQGKKQPVMEIFTTFFSIVSGIAFYFAWLLIIAGIALLANMFFEKNLNTVTGILIEKPLNAFGIGFITLLAFPFIMVILSITIILIPIVLLLALLLVAIILYGWIIIGTEVGKRLTAAMKVTWPIHWTAAFGTFIMTFAVSLVDKIIPCLGWIPQFAIAVTGMGAVVIYFYRRFQNRSGSGFDFLPKTSVPHGNYAPKEGEIIQSSNDLTQQSVPAETAPENPIPAEQPEAPEAQISADEQLTISEDAGQQADETHQSQAPDNAAEDKDKGSSSAEKNDTKTENKRSLGASLLDSIHDDLANNPENRE